MDHILTKMIAERERLQSLAKTMENEMVQFPDGFLSYKNTRGIKRPYHIYYGSNKKKVQSYLSKKNTALMEKLLRKKFIKVSLVRIRKRIQWLDKSITAYVEYDPDKCLKLVPGYEAIHESVISAFSIFASATGNQKSQREIKAWLAAPTQRNPIYPENLIHTTSGGERVRSKSEAIIAGMLYTYGIPYKYEAELVIGENRYYPDFKIMRPYDGRILYWEHLGLLANPVYKEKFYTKVQNYMINGILPWRDLIITFDEPDGSIDVTTIENLIKVMIMR